MHTRRLWRLEMAKSDKNPKCSFFITNRSGTKEWIVMNHVYNS
jgi:hypothetical protein